MLSPLIGLGNIYIAVVSSRKKEKPAEPEASEPACRDERNKLERN